MTTVLITGASRGIGHATTLVLARAGYTVIASMRDLAAGHELRRVAERESLPVHLGVLDVRAESVDERIASMSETHGPIDVLVNNAGIVRSGSIEELPLEDFRATMETNFFGMVRCIKAVLPAMRARKAGHIINISSVSGHLASSPLGAYAASKFAVEAMSEALAQEVLPLGIRVTVVQPGTTDTGMVQPLMVDRGGSIYPTEAESARYFRTAQAHAIHPDQVGTTILTILREGRDQFRYPVGEDARASLRHRAEMSDELWIRTSFNGEIS